MVIEQEKEYYYDCFENLKQQFEIGSAGDRIKESLGNMVHGGPIRELRNISIFGAKKVKRKSQIKQLDVRWKLGGQKRYNNNKSAAPHSTGVLLAPSKS